MTSGRRKVVAAAAGLAGSLAGCAGGSGGSGSGETTETEPSEPTATATATATPTPSGPPKDATTTTITVENKTFVPMVAEVEPGTVVEWADEGIGSHSVTSMSPSSSKSSRRAWNPDVASDWEMDEDTTSDPVSHYFPEPGVYEYKCSYDFGHVGGQDYEQGMLLCEPQYPTATSPGGRPPPTGDDRHQAYIYERTGRAPQRVSTI